MKKIFFLLIIYCFVFGNVNIQKVDSLFYSGNILDAKTLLETIDDKNEEIYYLAYQIYLKLDDLNNANKNLQNALKINEDKYFEEGEKLGELINDLKNVNKTLTSGFINEAINESKKLIEKYKTNSICHYRLGFAYKENKDYDNAVLYFNKAKELNPYNSIYQDEITYISNIEMLKGKEFYDLKDYQLALEHFNKALEYDPINSAAMFRIGNIYYTIKDYLEAANFLERGIKINEKNYKVFYMLGKCYVALNEPEKALLFFDKSLGINPNYLNAIFEKAKINQFMSNIDESMDYLNEIIAIDKSYYRAYELLIDIEVSRSNLDQAISYGNSALISSPDAYSIMGRLAAVYNEQKLYDKARENAKLSIKAKKNYAPALFELGIAEMNLCNKVAAKDAFTKCKRDRNYRRTASDYLKQENFEYYTNHCN